MDYILLLIGLVTGGIIGFLAARISTNGKNDDGADSTQQMRIDNATLNASNENLTLNLATVNSELESTRESYRTELKSATEWKSKYSALEDKIKGQKEEFEALQTKFTKEFTNSVALKKQKEEGLKKKLVGFKMVDKGIPRHDYQLKKQMIEKHQML